MTNGLEGRIWKDRIGECRISGNERTCAAIVDEEIQIQIFIEFAFFE